jgi:hypothetical protein
VGCRIAPRREDRWLVDVVPVDYAARIAKGQADRRPSLAAADVGHPGAVLQQSLHVGNLRQDRRGELIQEQGTVDGALRLPRIGAELLP